MVQLQQKKGEKKTVEDILAGVVSRRGGGVEGGPYAVANVLPWFSESKKGFLVGACQVGKRGQDRVNPGETCLPPYSGKIVLKENLKSYLALGLSSASVVSSPTMQALYRDHLEGWMG